jgi:hypothetical protein
MNELSHLYEQDYRNWALINAQLLQTGRFGELDIEHLITELSDMSKSERNELENRLLILLAHLLKWQYQYHQLSEKWQEFKGDSWRRCIVEQCHRIERCLKKSPGLKNHLEEAIADVYGDAVKLAADETGLPMNAFPSQCPYSTAQIFDKNFYPELGHIL